MIQKFLALLLLSAVLFSCTASKTTVFLLPTLHKFHLVNEQYSYDGLRKKVAALKPDVIAVEIRPEDIDRDSTYLKKNYPYEMWMMMQWFPQIKTEGFDWLGSDIQGKAIPENYWKEISPIKKYEKELAADSVYSAERKKCDRFNVERLPILKTKSLPEILQSNDAALTKNFYGCLSQSLHGSIHQRVTDFYDRRNSILLKNIKKITAKNRNKRILILTGDDHYVFLKDKIPHRTH